MSGNQGLHHVAMNVRDIERSLAFYGNAFAFRTVRRWGEETKAAMMDMGDGALLELFEHPEIEPREGTLLHIALRVEDIDASYARALAAGAREQVTPTDVDLQAESMYPIRIAFVVGPDNESIELFRER